MFTVKDVKISGILAPASVEGLLLNSLRIGIVFDLGAPGQSCFQSGDLGLTKIEDGHFQFGQRLKSRKLIYYLGSKLVATQT